MKYLNKNFYKGQDNTGNYIVRIFDKNYNVISEEEQKNKKYTLYLWADTMGQTVILKFGATHKTVWDRYSDAGTVHFQQIKVWESNLWDKDFEKLLHEKFKHCGKKEENEFYSEEAYEVFSSEEVDEFIKTVTHHVVTEGKELEKSYNNEIKNKNHKKAFSIRTNQQKFIDKLKSYMALNRKQKRFLVYAVCRFGKTASTLFACVQVLKAKKILILSSKCDTYNSWKTDFYKWNFTKDYIFADKFAIQDDNSLLNENNLICWCSFQSSAKNFEEIDTADIEEETWQRLVAKSNWDVIITDECHFGVDTDRSKKFLDELFFNNEESLKLEISATPFKKIKCNEYTFENTFTYTLTDEYNDYKNGILNQYVPVKMFHLDLAAHIKNVGIPNSPDKHSPESRKKLIEHLNNSYGEDNKFSWKAYFDQFTKNEIGVEFNLLYKTHFSKTGKHCLIFVNNVSSGNKLAKGLDDDDFNVINVCGNNKISLEEINKALNEDKPCMIISCGRFMTGVTMNVLTNVIFMGTVNSAENYIQFGLRAKNNFEGRTEACNIYDLNPNNYVYSDAFKDLIYREAQIKKLKPKEIARMYEEACCMLEWENGVVFSEFNNFAEIFEKNISHIQGNEQCPYLYIEDNLLLSLAEILNGKKIKNDKFNLPENEIITKAKEIKIETKNNTQTIEKSIENSCDEEQKKFQKKIERDRKKLLLDLKHKLYNIIGYLPSYMKHNNLNDVNLLIEDEVHQIGIKIWHDIDFNILIKLKNLIDEESWKDFCENILNIKNNLQNDMCNWKYKGLIPRWMVL